MFGRRGFTGVAAALAGMLVATDAAGAQVLERIVVSPHDGPGAVAAAIARAPERATVQLRAGVYHENLLVVDRALTLEGTSEAVLDGSGLHGILLIKASGVTVRGLVFRNTGTSQSEERAGVRVSDAANCLIEGNRFEQTFFAVYLEKVAGCRVRDNRIRSSGDGQMVLGNGIHAWQSERIEVDHNVVSGHRDGIYFEFVKQSFAHDNVSERSQRYGMHFMFSDDCRYERNTYRANGAGVAVMYSHRVYLLGNRFEQNWGAAAYGLLLKDISDSEIRNNVFVANSVGLYLEDSNRNAVAGNEFRENGWALKLLASASDNEITGNSFTSNSFDVSTNSRRAFSTFSGNYWDRYRGYDLDRDGIGDVPHAPVRLFSLIVEQSPPSLILLRSLLVDLLDIAERVLPVLTPDAMLDPKPLMREPAGMRSHGPRPAVTMGCAPDAVAREWSSRRVSSLAAGCTR